MKRLSNVVAITIILFSLTLVPLAAQEGQPDVLDMYATLAEGAAKGFLTTLTEPALADMRGFYLVNERTVNESLSEIEGRVTGYRISDSYWVNGSLYRTVARLQPLGRTLNVDTGWYNGRWKVEAVSFVTVTPTVASVTTPTTQTQVTTVNSGPPPIDNGLTGQIVFQTHSGSDIYRINADGTGLRRVTNGIDPQLSPDGTQIVFTRWEPNYGLYTINTDGTNEQVWAMGWRQMKSPSWSADGTKLVFSYQSGGRLEDEIIEFNPADLIEDREEFPEIPDYARDLEFEDGEFSFRIPMDAHWYLQQVDLTTGEYLDVPTGNRYSYGSSWHPTDASKLIFRGDRGLGLYDVNQQVTQRITQDPQDKAAVISPDGQKIALSYWQNGNWEIHVMNIDGSMRQRLTETPMRVVATEDRRWNNAAPAWSPDSQHLLFVTDRTGAWEIWIMNPDGTNQRPMFTNGALADISLQYDGVDERMMSWR